MLVVIVEMNKDRYFNATSRHEKTYIAQQVVLEVAQTGCFRKFDKCLQGWVEVSEATARQKVCQTMQYRLRRVTPGEPAVPFPNAGYHAQLSESQQPVAAAASRDHQVLHAAFQSKEAGIADGDPDFLSLLQLLAQGADQQHQNDRRGSAPQHDTSPFTSENAKKPSDESSA